jgi:hypothetical protein
MGDTAGTGLRSSPDPGHPASATNGEPHQAASDHADNPGQGNGRQRTTSHLKRALHREVFRGVATVHDCPSRRARRIVERLIRGLKTVFYTLFCNI